MRTKQLKIGSAKMQEFLLQMLETEMGGKRVYETALRCVQDENLKEEFEGYPEQAERHLQIVRDLMEMFRVDPEAESIGRGFVRRRDQALVQAMETALEAGDMDAAELVACDSVIDDVTRDHRNWERLGELMKSLNGNAKSALQRVYDVEEEESEYLHHTVGWTRELWLHFLGLENLVAPPEDVKHVKAVIATTPRPKQARAERTGFTPPPPH